LQILSHSKNLQGSHVFWLKGDGTFGQVFFKPFTSFLFYFGPKICTPAGVPWLYQRVSGLNAGKGTCADYFTWRMCPHLIAVLAIVYPLEYDIDFLLAPSHPESHRREYLKKVDGTFRP